MKHLLNNLSTEEKNSILEQHEGGIKIKSNKFKYLVESKLGNVKPLIMEQGSQKSVLIKVKTEGWGKIPKELSSNDSPTPKCTYSGYFLSFKYNGIYYDIDLNGIISGVRGDTDSFENMHKLLTEGIVEGVFMCGTNESLINPIEFEGVKYLQLFNGTPASEVLTNIKQGDKTLWGGFDGTNENFIIVNNGGSWVQGKLTHRKIN